MRFGGSGSDGPDFYCLCASCLTLAPWRHSTARSMSGTVKNILDGASGGSLHALKGGTDEAVLGGQGLDNSRVANRRAPAALWRNVAVLTPARCVQTPGPRRQCRCRM